MMCLVRKGLAAGSVEEPRQLREVHCVEVEKVAPPTHTGDGGIHCVQLPWRHNAVAILSAGRSDGNERTHRRSPG